MLPAVFHDVADLSGVAKSPAVESVVMAGCRYVRRPGEGGESGFVWTGKIKRWRGAARPETEEGNMCFVEPELKHGKIPRQTNESGGLLRFPFIPPRSETKNRRDPFCKRRGSATPYLNRLTEEKKNRIQLLP
ncbi:hypothetical protein J6590_014710 [Homalodisca vitripennis]|nr:hypothetical protein J6590_014710 [Homalodisca vitripennis]